MSAKCPVEDCWTSAPCFREGGWHGFTLFGKLSERSNNGMRTVIEMTIGLVVMAGAVQAQTFINTCPTVITSPGRYVLTADLICGGGDGITINSGDVTLALEVHTITAGV